MLRGQRFSSITDFVNWVKENTTIGKCAVCGNDILIIPFGRKRIVCGPACARTYREEEKMRTGRICVTCGRKITNAQHDFILRRGKRYLNLPKDHWYHKIEAEQAAELARTGTDNTPDDH